MTFKTTKDTKTIITISAIIAVITITTLLSTTNSIAALGRQSQTGISQIGDGSIERPVSPFSFQLPNGAIDGVRYSRIMESSPVAEIQRGGSAILPIMIRTTTDKSTNVSFSTTFGTDQIGLTKMPPGVKVTVEPETVTLTPKQDVIVNLIVSVDPNAPDGLYHQELIGNWDDVNGFKGTSVILKIGNGGGKVLYPEDIAK